MYRVPSAVFISVNGVFTERVTVGWPVAYEPPAIETFALFAVSETSWKIGFAAGKSEPAFTDSSVPLIEMTTLVGGGDGGAGGVEGVLPLEPDDPEEPDDEDEPDEDDRRAGRRRRALAGERILAGEARERLELAGVGRRRDHGDERRRVGRRDAVVVVPASVGAAVAVDVGAAAGVVGVVEVVAAGAATGGRTSAALHSHDRVRRVRDRQHEHDGQQDDDLLLLRLLRLGRVGDLFLSHCCSFRAD